MFLAYQKMIQEKRAIADEQLVVFDEYDQAAIATAWRKWKNLPKPPTAVVCFNDIMACWLIHEIRKDGLSIPGDISVIGHDDIAEANRIGLTTIRSEPAVIAREVFALLDSPRQINEKGRVRTIGSEFIMRDSVGPPRSGPLKIKDCVS